MLLVIPPGDTPGGGQNIGAIQQRRGAVDLRPKGRTSKHQWHLRVLYHLHHQRLIAYVSFEQKGRGRFRPKNQIGFGTDGFCEPAVLFQRFHAIGCVPFMRLIDIGLNDPNGEALRARKMQLTQPIEPDHEDGHNG